MTPTAQRGWWGLILVAAALLMITNGARQSLGLFVSPINTTTGLGIVTISFALGIGQFVWGAVQPVAGAFADRYGPGRVLAIGIVDARDRHGVDAAGLQRIRSCPHARGCSLQPDRARAVSRC